MKRTAIKKSRGKPRPGRLKGEQLGYLRADCMLRDGGLCQTCGETVTDFVPDWHDRKYHMAHIKAKRIGLDTLDNVKTLCGSCHRDSHSCTVNGKFQHEKVRPHA